MWVKKTNGSFSKFCRASIITLLIFIWIFSSWPQIFNFPPKIQKAEAAINQTTYLSSTASAQITSKVSWQVVASAPASSNVLTSCKNAKTTGYCQETPGAANTVSGSAKPTAPNGTGWIYDTALDSTIPTGTWTFNMRTTNSSATGTGVMAICAWKVKVSAGAIVSSVNIINCVDGATNLQANTTSLFVSSVSVASVPATSFASNEFLYVEYWLHTTVAGGSTTGKMTFEANAGASDDIVLPGASTNLAASAPSQDSPANSATGVSTTPTFLMTATDPETDNLSYKVTIYSNSACSTVVQTNDQAVSATGWTGSNATCTASPTACYTSGTQGSFLTQTALTASTQYWWKASAKNPDGNTTFTDSSTCNTFTTAAATSLTFVVSTDNFSTLTPGSPVHATSTLNVNTNNTSGWNVTLYGNNVTATAKAMNDGAGTEITDLTPQWIIPATAATTTAGNAVAITNGQNVLAFRVMSASSTNSVSFLSTAWWGTSDTMFNPSQLWAGIASSTNASRIGNAGNGSLSASNHLNTVQYYLNVPSTQKTGTYTGTLTYTATANP